MEKHERQWLVCYDIRDRKRLYYAERICGDYAVRVQNSIYEFQGKECHVKEFKRLMEFFLDKDEDSLLIVELCDNDSKKRRKYGVEKPEEVLYEKYFQIL